MVGKNRPTPDPYAVLGVAREADGPAVHAAYRRAVRRTHPDAGGSAAEFEAVQEAYETLRDPARRAAHDARTRPARTATSSSPPPPPSERPSAAEPRFEPMDDLLADSRRLENEARHLAGLPPLDSGEAAQAGEDQPAGDSFGAILADAERQARDVAGAVARELRRRARRLL